MLIWYPGLHANLLFGFHLILVFTPSRRSARMLFDYFVLPKKNGIVICRTTFKWSNILITYNKLYNNKYMIASTQIANTEIFAFIAVLVFQLL